MTKTKSVSQAGLLAFKEKELADLRIEATRIDQDIMFYFDSVGSHESPRLDYSLESLIDIEKAYRRWAARTSDHKKDMPLEMLGRLIGIYLGEVIIKMRGGSWAVYFGKYHTHNQITVLTEAGHCDPLFFGIFGLQCKTVKGASDGEALFRFAKSVDRLSFASN